METARNFHSFKTNDLVSSKEKFKNTSSQISFIKFISAVKYGLTTITLVKAGNQISLALAILSFPHFVYPKKKET